MCFRGSIVRQRLAGFKAVRFPKHGHDRPLQPVVLPLVLPFAHVMHHTARGGRNRRLRTGRLDPGHSDGVVGTGCLNPAARHVQIWGRKPPPWCRAGEQPLVESALPESAYKPRPARLTSLCARFSFRKVAMPDMRNPARLFLGVAVLLSATFVRAEAPKLTLKKGDRIVIIGNTLAERMQYFGHFETLLHSRFPQLELVVRNLGWSADELTLRPRSQDFQDHGHRLEDEKPDVMIAAFGFNESFAGAAWAAEVPTAIWRTSSARRPPPATTAPRRRNWCCSRRSRTKICKSRTLPDGKKNNESI